MLARCQALRRRFEDDCSWEEATPTLKDPNRVPDPSTLRPWAHGLDPGQPAASFVRQTFRHVDSWLARASQADPDTGPLYGLTPILRVLWPLRL